jgi:hypothetical protein
MGLVRTVVPRAWQRFEYFDAREVLIRLAQIEGRLLRGDGDGQAAPPQAPGSGSYGVRRLAALFCYGMSRLIGRPVAYAPVESRDFDCVARWMIDETPHYLPVQIKELLPGERDPIGSFNAELASMSKRDTSPQLCVAIYMNRQLRLDPASLNVPELALAELWAFGAVVPDKSRWMLWGNLLSSPTTIEFAYPTY